MAEVTQIAFRTLKHVGIFDTNPVYQQPGGFQRPEGNLRCCCYSPNGKFFAWASPEQVSVVDPSTGHVVTSLPAPNVYEIGFSPLGTFIITWQRPSKDEDGNAVKNLKVWRTLDENAGAEGQRAVIGQYVQKSQTGWNLQYTDDEQYCARVVTNEVQFYQSSDLGTVWNHLRVEGVADFAIAPGKTHSVAVFVPERKGQPASVKVFIVPSFSAAVSQKTFYKADKVQLKWNSLGTSLIVLASTDVDKSNRSYYGESNMYILSANGGFDSRITLDKEGPIHDVTWNPNSKEFGVVYGYMPAKTVIFNTKAETKKAFPLGPRNTILFSPHGRFVLVAGFGNLAGQLDVYDLAKDYAKVTTIEASNTSVCEWSPDGVHILTAITSPRLRVDNGIKLWHFGGALMYKEDMDELYDVKWRPLPLEQFPLPDEPVRSVPTPHPSAVAYLGTVKTPSKPAGAYRPPGARGTSTPLHFKREDEGGSAFSSNGIGSTPTAPLTFGARSRRREVPGAEAADPSDNKRLPPGAVEGGGVSLTLDNNGDDSQLSKAALKNKKKREAKKAKEKAEADGTLAAAVGEANAQATKQQQQQPPPLQPAASQQQPRGDAGRGPRSGEAKNKVPAPSKAKGAAAAAAAAAAATAAADEMADGGGENGLQDKRVRALLKKLRAIDELKMRQAGGEKLELSQISKIQTEEKVRQELEAIGGSVS